MRGRVGAVLAAAGLLAATAQPALARERPTPAPSCTVPAAARFVEATFADINAGRGAALAARIDRRPRRFLAFSPFGAVGIAPAPPSPRGAAVQRPRAIARYAARRQAAGERLTLTGLKLERRSDAGLGLTVYYTRAAPDLGDGVAYPAAAKAEVYCRRGTYGAFAGGATARGPRAPDPVPACRSAIGTRPLGRLGEIVLCGRTLAVRPADEVRPIRPP
jgi:hypothetical protein